MGLCDAYKEAETNVTNFCNSYFKNKYSLSFKWLKNKRFNCIIRFGDCVEVEATMNRPIKFPIYEDYELFQVFHDITRLLSDWELEHGGLGKFIINKTPNSKYIAEYIALDDNNNSIKLKILKEYGKDVITCLTGSVLLLGDQSKILIKRAAEKIV